VSIVTEIGDLLAERKAFQKCKTNPMGFLAKIANCRTIDYYRKERRETHVHDPLISMVVGAGKIPN
jgi:DNA-directed RNA polymerase specialized sigma24 family protein